MTPEQERKLDEAVEELITHAQDVGRKIRRVRGIEQMDSEMSANVDKILRERLKESLRRDMYGE